MNGRLPVIDRSAAKRPYGSLHRCLEMELDVNQANGFVLGMKINDGKERAIKQE